MRGGHKLLDEVIQTHFSLFDESCGWREEGNVKPLPHSPGDEMLSRMKTKISAPDWLICPFWLSTSCSREDLRVAHRALMLRAYGLCNPGHSPRHQQRWPAFSIPTTTNNNNNITRRLAVYPRVGLSLHRNEELCRALIEERRKRMRAAFRVLTGEDGDNPPHPAVGQVTAGLGHGHVTRKINIHTRKSG